MSDAAANNTDREIWRERPGDFYSDSIHVTERGGIGIDCGGYVMVKPIREWHRIAKECCREGIRPRLGLGNNAAFPEQFEIMEGIVGRLRYDLPVEELIILMRNAGSSLDNRPRFGNDLMRCLIHNGAERLELLASKIDTRPWRTWRQSLADAWAVFRGRAQAIYVNGSVYDRTPVQSSAQSEAPR